MVEDGVSIETTNKKLSPNLAKNEPDEIFTFKPKVSQQSLKLAEKLKMDFMERQQNHIERQRKHKTEPNYSQSGPETSADVSLAPATPTPKTTTQVLSKHQITEVSSEDVKIVESEMTNKIGEDFRHLRSKTMPMQANGLGRLGLGNRKLSTITSTKDGEKLKYAKEQADTAIKQKKIFTIQGPYGTIRESLRKRGWVEKFYKLHIKEQDTKPSPRQKRRKTVETDDDDEDPADDYDADGDPDADDDDDDEEGKVPPWEEDDGVYGIMSRIVRNNQPSLYWLVRRDAVDYKAMKKDSLINHYGKTNFTTKVGLLLNLRQTPWFESVAADDFFPRCYRLSNEEEKQAFIEDYQLTTCTNILKWVVEVGHEQAVDELEDLDILSPTPPDIEKPKLGKMALSPRRKSVIISCTRYYKKKRGGVVPITAVELAVDHLNNYLIFKLHQDIDNTKNFLDMSQENWDQLLQWYYKIMHENAVIPGCQSWKGKCEQLLTGLKDLQPQFAIDGMRNVWIVKPGAKSRGRGIICYDHLEDMLKLVNTSIVQKDGKFVVQKYIERPLLIYNTKFDIRQWFLVTDWNPLTVWFYKDCYLRFCSQQFTLDNFDGSIHLSNNAIQKYCVNGPRSSALPAENMWSSDEFKNYLREKGKGSIWEDIIYPGMQRAIICSMVTSQDIIEQRKGAFELYGADFMLTPDYAPWLIEINSSPSMSRCTKVTNILVPQVLEDTIKVVVDRRSDKNADTGQFELIYKQNSVTVPPYIGLDLSLQGQSLKIPGISPSNTKLGLPIPHLKMSTDNPTRARRNALSRKEDNDLEMKRNNKAGGSDGGRTSGGSKKKRRRKKRLVRRSVDKDEEKDSSDADMSSQSSDVINNGDGQEKNACNNTKTVDETSHSERKLTPLSSDNTTSKPISSKHVFHSPYPKPHRKQAFMPANNISVDNGTQLKDIEHKSHFHIDHEKPLLPLKTVEFLDFNGCDQELKKAKALHQITKLRHPRRSACNILPHSGFIVRNAFARYKTIQSMDENKRSKFVNSLFSTKKFKLVDRLSKLDA